MGGGAQKSGTDPFKKKQGRREKKGTGLPKGEKCGSKSQTAIAKKKKKKTSPKWGGGGKKKKKKKD